MCFFLCVVLLLCVYTDKEGRKFGPSSPHQRHNTEPTDIFSSKAKGTKSCPPGISVHEYDEEDFMEGIKIF